MTKAILVCGLLLFGLPAAGQADRLHALILTGASDAPYHDWRQSTPFLRGVLERSGRFDVKVIEQVPGITAAMLAPFDVLVLDYNGPRFGAPAEQAIEEFVRAGKGLISVHAVTYGPAYGMVFDSAARRWKPGPDDGWPAYPALIGARWDTAKIGHGARHVFPVKWTDPEHPICRGLPPSFAADDELYHRLELLPGSHVLATAFSDPATGGTGRDEPIVWSAAFGRGRIVHVTLGHDLRAMAQPGFQAAFARGAEWAATGAVRPPAVQAKTPAQILP
jgi:type 1 glutamine amidotransferase